MADSRFHVVFSDPDAGESLGLLLTEVGGPVGFSRRLINPYAAKGSSGYTQESDLTEWSVVSQKDWRGGRGQEDYLENEKYLDAWGLETRIDGQITLGPLPHQQVATTVPRFEPGNTATYGVGYPRAGNWIVASHDEPLLTSPARAQKIDIGGQVPQWYSHFDARISSVEVRIRKYTGTTDGIKLSIYSSSGGLPDSEVASKTLTAADVSTSYGWVEFTFTTPYAVTAGSYYWIVLSSLDIAPGYSWQRSGKKWALRGGAKFAAAGWERVTWDHAFKMHWTQISRSQSFKAPTGGMSCELVQLYLFDVYTHSDDTFTVALCDDNSGVPGTVLKTKNITGDDVPTRWEWIEVEWGSPQALASETTYHITVTPAAEQTGRGFLCWGGKSAGGYSDGVSKLRLASGSWTAQTQDLYFRANRDDLQGNVVAFTRYDGNWYCAAGDSVYKWNTVTDAWDSSDQVSSKNVVDLYAWGEWLWASRGSGSVLRRYNGAAWSDVAGKYANYLMGGLYFHYSDASATNTHKVYYTGDGASWSGPISCGTQQHGITAMAWFKDHLVVSTPVRLWTVVTENDGIYPTLDWSSQEDSNNGKGMLVWGRTGELYIPLRFGLYRYNGDTMVPVGPEQGTGLPAARAGRVVEMAGTGNWLFTAIDAGSGTSSILVYNGMGGWHEIARAERAGQRIYTLGFETLSSPSRLWYGLNKETHYLILPDYSDNPWQYTGYKYNAGGELIMSWMGGNLLEIIKDLYEVVVRAENVSTSRPVLIYYEVDRSGTWVLLGEITESPRQSLAFTASGFASKTVGTGSTKTTIELGSGEVTTDMAPGDWCRINAEVSQVASITDTDTFVLETALSESPESGDTVYASLPAGREFRLKLVMSSDDEDKAPLLKTVFIRYQNNVADRFAYTLAIRVEDGMTDLVGNPYTYTAADLRVKLDEWVKRNLSFTLVDPDGVEVTVKIAAGSEGGFKRERKAPGATYGSTYNINLVQVA